MASERGDGGGLPEGGERGADGSHEPRECMPCRGTGQVVSHLGGTTSTVTCPWCGGGGVRLAGVDAQARWLQGDAEDDAEKAPPEPAA
jgi:hypothetical protein